MIRDVLIGQVACAEEYGDPSLFPLYPEEESIVARANEERRREFATVRWCARQALNEIGQTVGAILPDEKRVPIWPVNVVGSMTHCRGYRAAAVALKANVVGLGIDAEPNEPLPPGVLEHIATDVEVARVRAIDVRGLAVDRLLFSAKEAVYKFWFPLTRRWLDFPQVEIRIWLSPQISSGGISGTFSAQIMLPGLVLGGLAADTVGGRWIANNGLVITSVVISR